jgi:hypothetical protein
MLENRPAPPVTLVILLQHPVRQACLSVIRLELVTLVTLSVAGFPEPGQAE